MNDPKNIFYQSHLMCTYIYIVNAFSLHRSRSAVNTSLIAQWFYFLIDFVNLFYIIFIRHV